MAVLVAVGFALSVAVMPTGHRVDAEEPLAETAPTTVPASTTTEATTTTEITVPAPTVPEPTVPADTTTTTAAEATPTVATPTVTTTTVATTIEPPAPEATAGPAARNAPFAAAVALTGLALTITDPPFAVSPTSLAFGSYVVGSTATETVTLTNGAGREVVFQALTSNGISVTGVTGGPGCRVLDPIFAPREYVLSDAQTCDLSVTVDTSSVGPVNGRLELADTNTFQGASMTVTAVVVPPAPPANDDWVNAQDLSSLAIPPFVGVPGQFPGTQQPSDTVSVDGSTEFATYEAGEFSSRPGGSLWYRYTSPPGGFAGRLGYRATPGFFVDVTTENTSATQSQRAQGNTWGPSFIQHVWMEPGHTVWFRVSNEFVDPGPFTLELFQAPDEQDSIVEAYGGTGAGEFALSTDFRLSGNGDTHHLSSDLGGAPNGWATLRFAVPGLLSVRYRSATAKTVGQFGGSEGSERPLSLRIYRSPQATAVNDPTVLGAAIAIGADEITDDLDCCILRVEVGDDRNRCGDTRSLLLGLRGGSARTSTLHLRCGVPCRRPRSTRYHRPPPSRRHPMAPGTPSVPSRRAWSRRAPTTRAQRRRSSPSTGSRPPRSRRRSAATPCRSNAPTRPAT